MNFNPNLKLYHFDYNINYLYFFLFLIISSFFIVIVIECNNTHDYTLIPSNEDNEDEDDYNEVNQNENFTRDAHFRESLRDEHF
tara:strand:- start:428 stop:679 length:252 start_codon:yes stop_codon:yes gene_type:complete